MLKSIQINIALIKKGETRGEGKKVIRKLKCATSRLLAFILALCMVCQVPAYAGPAEVTADGNEAAAIGGLAETEFTIEHVFGEERAVLTAKTRAGAKPATPSNVRISEAGDSFTLSWEKAENAKGYKILHANSLFGTYEVVKTIAEADTTSATVSHGADKYSNYYRIVAVNGEEEPSSRIMCPWKKKCSGIIPSFLQRRMIRQRSTRRSSSCLGNRMTGMRTRSFGESIGRSISNREITRKPHV